MSDAPQDLGPQLDRLVTGMLVNGITERQAVEVFTRHYLQTALSRAKGNVSAASRAVGCHRNTFHNKLRSIPGIVRRPRYCASRKLRSEAGS